MTTDDVVRAWVRWEPERATSGRLTVGVKDVFDTADFPTEHGSPIYAGNQPRGDAAAVALLRRAGFVVVGKTVTAELAWFTPGPTTNPHRPAHTPGGSSSGSAAAVAAGMVDLAVGTQTAGSVIRPASFCGVFGYKPTFGLVPTAGVKQAAPSLDTVGLFAADLDVLVRGARAATTRPLGRGEDDGDVRFALVRTEQWDDADPDCRDVVERAAAAVHAEERDLPQPLVGLAAAQPLVQAYEGARSLAWERTTGLLSDDLERILAWGDVVDHAEYDEVRRRAAAVPDELFGDADVVVTPAVVGEAPAGLATTGDPRFCRLWTLLGVPSITVPGLSGATGLPIGVQLVARRGDDARLLAAARALHRAIS